MAFETFFDNRPIFGPEESITIQDVGKLQAKIDSGNEAYNVLHGVDQQVQRRQIKFTTVGNKRLVKPIVDIIDIVAGGETSARAVVSFDIEFQGKQYKDVRFSIADRSKNDEPVLIGAPFLKKINALIDLDKQANAEEPALA